MTQIFAAPSGDSDMQQSMRAMRSWGPHEVGGAQPGAERLFK